MSAALQFLNLAAAAGEQALWHGVRRKEKPISELELLGPKLIEPEVRDPELLEQEMPKLDLPETAEQEQAGPVRSLAFYRKHTEKILLRYLYSSLLVGRAPQMLSEPLTRGWVSNRPVKTFEESVIFVLDMEKCLSRLSALERLLLSRVVLQDYSLAETALMLRISTRTTTRLHWGALDRLTRILLDEDMLVVPAS